MLHVTLCINREPFFLFSCPILAFSSVSQPNSKVWGSGCQPLRSSAARRAVRLGCLMLQLSPCLGMLPYVGREAGLGSRPWLLPYAQGWCWFAAVLCWLICTSTSHGPSWPKKWGEGGLGSTTSCPRAMTIRNNPPHYKTTDDWLASAQGLPGWSPSWIFHAHARICFQVAMAQGKVTEDPDHSGWQIIGRFD